MTPIRHVGIHARAAARLEGFLDPPVLAGVKRQHHDATARRARHCGSEAQERVERGELVVHRDRAAPETSAEDILTSGFARLGSASVSPGERGVRAAGSSDGLPLQELGDEIGVRLVGVLL